MEDDGALGEPEFWVSRTIQHAMDARTMGINGLLGIHWRTREVSLQFTAMAMFPWIVTPKGHQTLTAYDVCESVMHAVCLSYTYTDLT